MKILVITTGGTIGSSFDGVSVNVNADRTTPVIELFQKEYTDVSFDVISPLNILSESVSASDFETLWEALCEVDFSLYDGVIVTCGSDTLAYLSSFVGLLFSHRPIAVVCANKILTAPDSNGYENFKTAVKTLRSGLREVFVPYRNTDGVTYLHSATELRQADYHDDFHSLYTPYAVFDGAVRPLGEFVCHTFREGVFDKDHPLKLKKKVLMLSPYPLLDYESLELSAFKAVLHLTYHSGTLHSENAAKLMDKAGERPVFLSPLKKGAKLYKTTVDMIDRGMIPLFDISPECAYMKLLLCVNQDRFDIKELMGE